jgi:predicted dehydrogenase
MTDALITPRELSVSDEIPLPQRADWRIGMIGFGGIAQGAHLPAYLGVGWDVAAVADPNPEAQAAAREAGIERVYSSHRDMIADGAIEVIDLLTQPTLREEIVRDVVEAGLPLITEKPFARTVVECARMVDIAASNGVPLGVHQNYRWMRMNLLAHHIVGQGLIGTPYYAAIEVHGTQDEQLHSHNFYSVCDDFLTIQWNNHLADLLRYWTGRDAARVLTHTGRMNGQTFASDNLLLSIHDFGDGLTGHITHSELLRSDLHGVWCRVDGDKGSIAFDWHSWMRIDSRELGGGPKNLMVDDAEYAESFAGSMGDFLLAIEAGREPLVSGRRNLATIRTITAEHQSALNGGIWVDCVDSEE